MYHRPQIPFIFSQTRQKNGRHYSHKRPSLSLCIPITDNRKMVITVTVVKSIITDYPIQDNSLRSEIGRTLRIQVGCTHSRTNKNHYNAYISRITKFSTPIMPHGTWGKCTVVVPIYSEMGATKWKFWVLRSS